MICELDPIIYSEAPLMIKYDLYYPFASTIFTSVVILFLDDVNGTPTP